MLRNKTALIIILLILSLGFLLRIHDLGKECFYVDEAVSIFVSTQNLPSAISTIAGSNHPPFYFILLHFWMKIFGTTECSARFPSLIFGVLCIIMLYKIGKRLFEDKVGLFAAFLFAVSQYQIYYSQEARMYTLVLFLGLCSTFLYLKLTQASETSRSFFVGGYVLTTLLGIYTNYGMIPLVLFQNIFYFSTEKSTGKKVKAWLISQVMIFIFLLPWLPIIFRQAIMAYVQEWTKTALGPCPGSIKHIFAELLLGYYISSWKIKMLGAAIFLPLLTLGAFTIKKETEKPVILFDKRKELVFLLFWVFTPVVFFFAISFIMPFMLSRIIILIAPALYILASKGLCNIRTRHIQMIFVSLIVFFSFFSIQDYYLVPKKPLWKQITQYIKQNEKPDDLILFSDDWLVFPFDHYYDGKLKDREIVQIWDEHRIPKENCFEKKKQRIKSHERFWFFSVGNPLFDDSALMSFVQKQYRKISEMHSLWINLYLFETGKDN